MQKFTVETDVSFKFTSTKATDSSEVFTAFKDYYENGYIIIDSKHRPFILDIDVVYDMLDEGVFKIVSECSTAIH